MDHKCSPNHAWRMQNRLLDSLIHFSLAFRGLCYGANWAETKQKLKRPIRTISASPKIRKSLCFDRLVLNNCTLAWVRIVWHIGEMWALPRNYDAGLLSLAWGQESWQPPQQDVGFQSRHVSDNYNPTAILEVTQNTLVDVVTFVVAQGQVRDPCQ